MRAPAATALATLVSVMLVTGCVAPDTAPATEIVVTAQGFDPVSAEATTGADVLFVNRTDDPQRVVSAVRDDGTPAVPPGAEQIDSDRLSAGATFAVRLDVPGEYVVRSALADDGSVVTLRVVAE